MRVILLKINDLACLCQILMEGGNRQFLDKIKRTLVVCYFMIHMKISSEINKLYQCKRYLRTYWETVIFFQCTAQEQCHNFHLPLKSDKNTPNRQFFHISLLLQVPWGETTKYKVVFARFKFFNLLDRLKCDQGTSNFNLKTIICNHRKKL